MANVGYINPEVAKMYGIPYSQLTPEQKRILHEDSLRRAKLIKEREEAVLKNNLKAFEDEAKMEKVLASIYEDCQKQILAQVTETIAKVQKAGGEWSYANQSALTRSRGLFEQIQQQLTILGQKEQITFTQGLSNIYTDQFLRQVYELGQSVTVKANFNRLNPALIKRTLDYPWSGAMFSDRLWNDKARLGQNLRVGLTQSMILGESIPQITDRINKGIDTARYNAERVARTETKRVTYVAHNDVYEDMGVEELEYRCANGGDSRTCDTCMGDNGKHFVRGKEPTLPRHPNCRCVYIPVVSDTFGNNELNELTGSVRGAENYEKWKNTYAEAINPDGSYKDGWSMDFKTGKTVYTTEDGKKLTLEEYKKLQSTVKSPKVATTGGDAKYNEALTKLDNDYVAKNTELSTLQANYSDVEKQYKSYGIVRRGLDDPTSLGFATKDEFDLADKALSKKLQDLQQSITDTQKALSDIMIDRAYLLRAGADKVDTLEDYVFIREALRKNRYFDYDKYGDDLVEAILKMDPKDLKLQREFFKDGARGHWDFAKPTELFKEGAISEVRLLAKVDNVVYNDVKRMAGKITEEEIIDKLAGGDMTTGSCSSLAFSYIGNRLGLDVTDYRGGASQHFFSMNTNIQMISNLPNVGGKLLKVKKEASDTAKLIKGLEYGKEYYIAVGKHASIIKNTEQGAMYLELQSGVQNGWMPFDRYGSMEATLQKRFGCRKTVDRFHGQVWEKSVVLIDVDGVGDTEEFRKVLGYLNTATDKQKKGVAGSVK